MTVDWKKIITKVKLGMVLLTCAWRERNDTWYLMYNLQLSYQVRKFKLCRKLLKTHWTSNHGNFGGDKGGNFNVIDKKNKNAGICIKNVRLFEIERTSSRLHESPHEAVGPRPWGMRINYVYNLSITLSNSTTH